MGCLANEHVTLTIGKILTENSPKLMSNKIITKMQGLLFNTQHLLTTVKFAVTQQL